MEQQINTENFQIVITLTVDQVNVILSALGAQPHDVVRQTLDSVVMQAQPQYESQVEDALKRVELTEETE